MNPNEIARLVGYLAALALGLFMAVWGVIHGDPTLAATGIALATTGTVAGANVPGVRGGRHGE